MKKRLIEGYWDCQYCGTQKIGGGLRECPNCGRVCDENTTFHHLGEHKYVDPEKAATINKNPDWICMYCNSLNSANNTNCASCGATRTSENLSYFENKKQKKTVKY